MKTTFLIALFLVVVACSAANAAECSTGQTKQEDCNTCFCANGNWACTLKACLRKRAADECLPGDRKTVECNTCFCANGLWACTKIGCHAKRAIPARFDVESRHKREEFSCIPGQTFAKECNTCTCTADGKNAICTLNPCDINKD